MANNLQIGVMVDSFRLSTKEGIRKAAEIGAKGVQIYAVAGEFTPENLTASDIREYRSLLDAEGLAVSALCGDLGGHGFTDPAEIPNTIERSRRIAHLCAELGGKVITTHIGVVPSDPNHPRYAVMQESCEMLARAAKEEGSLFAIETGPETPEVLCGFLDSLTTPGVGVNYDPANLVMVTGSDPVKGVYTLGKYIYHTHAKDGVRLKSVDPEILYGVWFAEGGIGDNRLEDYFLETPLGQGGVDFDGWIKALRDIGYEGFLTIEREVGADPAADIAMAADFLRSKL